MKKRGFNLLLARFQSLARLALLVAMSVCLSATLFAQEPSPTPTATPEPMEVKVRFSPSNELTFGSEEGASEEKTVPTVTLLSGQQVTVTLDFSDEKEGTPVAVGLYDGGQISGIDGVVLVPEGGAVPFTFQPGQGSGTYRAMVQVGTEYHLLQFSVRPPEEYQP
jgi:hypothetical protein